jgi:hypothetical protein
VTRFLLGLVPPWGWLLLLAAALATAGGWHLHQLHQARKGGRAEIQARWDAAELERVRQAGVERLRRMERATEESAAHAAARAAIARTLTETRDALRYALQTPISCPGGADMPLADVRLPAAALDSVRRAGAAPGQRAD